jgi:NodT family efflux transporter outer membrane factor (OMF) lipoprotein
LGQLQFETSGKKKIDGGTLMAIASHSQQLRHILLVLFLFSTGCMKVGPDFVRPTPNALDQWLETGDSRVKTEPAEYRAWWKAFNDPVLDKLIQTAYEQNLPLRIAGARVFEARARLGVAIGEQYPQVQQGFGSASYNRQSERAPTAPQQSQGLDFDFRQAQVGAAASWELDFWGKFRRAVESEDASFLSSIAAYDTALVSLTADVARTYVLVRTIEDRLRIARDNVVVQTESLRIARVRFEGGATSERDVQQALTQLRSTEATIPQLETSLRQAKNALSVLLGMPPRHLEDMLSGSSGIPKAPVDVAVGIPAELIRRRPDIQLAELQAAAQCALIGVAKADLYPAFSLTGTFGFLSSDVGRFHLSHITSWDSRTWSFGPSFQWNLLNYGQITNLVRVQDALFQELIFTYQDTVLRAQQEVEDGLSAFLYAQDRVVLLTEAADAAKRSADLALIQYREGATDYTTVLTAQQALLAQQDSLAVGQSDVPQGLIAVYRALGGGWEIREGKEFLPPDVIEAMQNRTNWGRLLRPAAVQPPTTVQLLTPDW